VKKVTGKKNFSSRMV